MGKTGSSASARSIGVRVALCVAVLSVVAVALTLAGCAEPRPHLGAEARAGRERCGGDGCHDDRLGEQADGPHSQIGCVRCHEGADGEHAGDPEAYDAATEWRIEACSDCHEGEAVTYVYDDNAQAGPYGGSIREPAQPKKATFPRYSLITSGHAFNNDYNEEGAHAWMLQDHYDIKRGKFEVCMQCKSTKVALAWRDNKPLTVAEDTTVKLTHVKPKPTEVHIPKGTVISYATDEKTRQVQASAKFPDGTAYSSIPKASEDATKNFNMMWAATVAATKETMPYGAGCNHCHDPHTTEPRLVRKSMLDAIESGGPDGKGGLNPYGTGNQRAKDLDKAPAQDVRNALCGQCHVEYTCGKSGVDGIDRDAFGWAKAGELHELYTKQFGYTQDWKHKVMGQPLIKSQHPELETFWNSTHYKVGAACTDCHMPEVSRNGKPFRSHWFTSPYKYSDPKLYGAFILEAGLDPGEADNPCDRCHKDRTAEGMAIQKRVFAAQERVSAALATSVKAFGEVEAAKAKGRKFDRAAYDAALEKHRRAHVLWENLIVSENSMGFHDPEYVLKSMAEAEKLAKAAAAGVKESLR